MIGKEPRINEEGTRSCIKFSNVEVSTHVLLDHSLMGRLRCKVDFWSVQRGDMDSDMSITQWLCLVTYTPLFFSWKLSPGIGFWETTSNGSSEDPLTSLHEKVWTWPVDSQPGFAYGVYRFHFGMSSFSLLLDQNWRDSWKYLQRNWQGLIYSRLS